MKLGLGNQLMVSPVNSVPLGERPTLGVSFDRSRYTNPLGFANQTAVGSSDFKLQSYAGPNVKFSRSSMATFRGSNGLIQYAPENLLQYSEQFNNSSVWATLGVSVSADQIASPSGAVSADKLTTNGAAAIQRISYNTAQIGLSCFSVYVKAGTASFVQLLHGSSSNVYANFNVSTGSVGNVGALTTASIQSVGNGWYRCVVSTAAIITGSSWHIYIVQSNTAAYGATFSATVANLYVWGAQLERHSTARPYISTTALPAVYGPRFEYDLNGNPLGLLMEEQSQNLLQYSEQFDNVYWSKDGSAGITPNDAIAPNGTSTADKLSLPSAGVSQLYRVFPITSGPLTASIWIRANSPITLNFGFYDSTIDTIAINVTTEWKRFTYTRSAGFTTANGRACWLYNINAGSSVVYIWGAQLEQKPFATSYIPTVGGTVVRSADLCSVDGADFSLTTNGGWFNPYNGTVVCKGNRFGLHTDVGDSIFDFTDTISSAASLLHFTDSPSELESMFLTFEDYTTQYPVTLDVFDPNDPAVRVAVSYQIGDYRGSFNGSVNLQDTQGQYLYTPNKLHIGSSPILNSNFNGHITDFAYYKVHNVIDLQTTTANP